jgi:membrane protein
MRLSHSVRTNLSVAAVLAGLGLLSVATRQPSRHPSQPLRRHSATDSGSLAALRDELRGVAPRPRAPASGGGARGREADTPSEIPARGWWDIAKRTASQTSKHRLMTEGAGITFYAILAIFPALAALVSIYGLVADPATVSGQLNALSGIVPGGGMDILGDELKQLASAGGGKLGLGAIIGILVALWSANGGTKAIFDSLNVVYDEHEKRGYVRRTLVSLAVTLGTLAFVVVAMVAVVALPIALNFVGLGKVTDILLRVARWPLLLVIVAVMLAVIYRYGPSRTEARWRWVSWGGAFAAIAWVLVSLAFSWYVAHFGSYNKTYGSLGAAIGFMTWIWISATIVLIGAELNAEMEHQTKRDTTTGAEKPLGARGANKADTVAPI